MRHVVQNWNSNLIFSQLHLLLLYIYIYRFLYDNINPQFIYLSLSFVV